MNRESTGDSACHAARRQARAKPHPGQPFEFRHPDQRFPRRAEFLVGAGRPRSRQRRVG
jgi:hypothetical protein